MVKNGTIERPDRQKTYRKSQQMKGIVRFELQVKAESKAKFEEMVKAAAKEYIHPWDERRRMAKARSHIFDEIMQGTLHNFTALKVQNDNLKAEVKALSPAFFKMDLPDNTPLPATISALPDDPNHLKQLMTKLYREAQQAKTAAHQHKQSSDQYQELYDISSQYNEDLKKQMKEHGLFVEE
jgi:hypothetical protein